MSEKKAPPMFVRAMLDGTYYDVAIADISAIEVPSRPGHAVHVILGGFKAAMSPESYQTVHEAWVARRRSSAGR